MLKLNNNVKVYIPIVKNKEGILNVILKSMSEEFGGVTFYSAKGFWMDDNNNLIHDIIEVAESFTDTPELKIKAIVSKYVEILKMDLKQDAVSIEINNKLFII